MEQQIKVGDYVGVKYDIEQSGKVERIEKSGRRDVYFVRLFEGNYVEDRQNGDLVPFRRDDIWID
jgi:hypothetical protein